MKLHYWLKLFYVAGLMWSASVASAFEHFITRDAHQLMDGDKVFRFAGIHAPELHRIEDDVQGLCDADERGWGQYFKWPTADEQENWVKSFVRTGHKAMRITVLSIEQEFDQACSREVHIQAPLVKGGMPRLNEHAMVHYDRMIALADRYGLRLILPFVDHWEWWGGRKQLAAFYGESEDDFYDVGSQTYAAYRNIIAQVILRRNTFTGRLYRDEKAILAWETGNELKGTTAEFLSETAAFIKSIDRNHLVIDGAYINVNSFALNDENVDIISNHLYENSGTLKPETILRDLKAIGGKKAYLVGEFGLLPIAQLREIMEEVVNRDYRGAKAVGAFIWGARGRRHNGGFYWHQEPANPKTWSYHLPGFPEGEFNEELEVIAMVRDAIGKMDGGTSAYPLPVPEAPKLREIVHPLRINWMGAPVGRRYRVERATSKGGPWEVIANNVSDGKHRYDPHKDAVFSDLSDLVSGMTYFYRVFAINESGESPPSNVESVTLGSEN